MAERKLTCTVGGSVRRFKREIDLAREELEDYGVEVLGMERGSVILPRRGGIILPYTGFAPLSSEVGKPIKVVEDGFIKSMDTSNFILFVNPDGSFHDTTAFEVGVGLYLFKNHGISLYATHQLASDPNMSIGRLVFLRNTVQFSIPIPEIARRERERLES